MSSSKSDKMKFTSHTYQQSRMVAGVSVPGNDYDELLREALRVALLIDTTPRDDFRERYTRIHELMVAYTDSPEGNDAPTMMARLAVAIIDVIPLAERKAR